MARHGGQGFYLRVIIVWLTLQVFMAASSAWAEPEGQPADVSGAEEEQVVARRDSETSRVPKRQERGPEAVPPTSSTGALSPQQKPQSQLGVAAPGTGTSSRGRISASSRTRDAPDPSRLATRGHSPLVGTRYVDDVVCGPAEQSCQAPLRTASGPAQPLLAAVTRWIADPVLYGIVTLAGILAIGALCTLEPRLRRPSAPRRIRMRFR
ncbi:MAG: hypothetical protein ACRDJF_00100 [Actinomycetota bacterium]